VDSSGAEAAGRANASVGPPFGPEFFTTVLIERVRVACDGHPDEVPVVELHLADGYILDLCHIPMIERQWLAAQAYRDKEICKEMDLMFIPYPLVTRVTVSMWHRNQRPIGFVLDQAPTDPRN
jgi:hypothetical protein